jgi:hypothetical protein
MKKDQKRKNPDEWKQRFKRFLQRHRLARSFTIGWMAVLLFSYHLLIGKDRAQKERIAIFATVCLLVMAVGFQYIYADSSLSKEVQQYMNAASGDASGDALGDLPEDVQESLTGDAELADVPAQDANVTGTEDALEDESGDAISLPNGQYTEEVWNESEDGMNPASSEETDMPTGEEQQLEDASGNAAALEDTFVSLFGDAVMSDDMIETASGDAVMSNDTTATASGDALALEDAVEEDNDVLDVVLPTTCHVWMTTDDGADVPVVRSAIENRSDFDVAVNVEDMRFSVVDRVSGVDRSINMVFEAVNSENEAKQVRMSGTNRVQSDVMSILLKASGTQGYSGIEDGYDLISDTDAYFRIYGTISTQMSRYWCEDDVAISVVFRFCKAE